MNKLSKVIASRISLALSKTRREMPVFETPKFAKFKEGERVLINGADVGVTVAPLNDHWDLKRNTWVYVYGRGYASCYANHNVTRHADQAASRLPVPTLTDTSFVVEGTIADFVELVNVQSKTGFLFNIKGFTKLKKIGF